MKRKWTSLVLALALCMGLCTPAFAYGDTGIAGKPNTLTCGYDSVAVIDENNTLWMWGCGEGGLMDDQQPAVLGYLEETWRSEPKKIMDDVLSVSVSANRYHPFAAAIKTDHSLWTWGWNDVGQLGNGGKGMAVNGKEEDIFQLKPQKIMENVAAVSCGSGHAAAIKTDGSLWLWGSGSGGTLGNGKFNFWDSLMQTPFKLMDGVTAVSCGASYTAAVKTDGSLWMWGSNAHNCFNNGSVGNHISAPQLPGDYFDSVSQTVPVKVMDGVSWIRCGIGIENPFVLLTDGTLVTWPTYSETTIVKDIFDQPKEVPVPPKQPLPLQVIAKDVVAASDGQKYPLGPNVVAYIKKDGTLWTYGDNRYCQLGFLLEDKNDRINWTDYTKASRVRSDITAVAVCGFNAVAAVGKDGFLWMWGKPEYMGMGDDVPTAYTRHLRDINGDPFIVECCTPSLVPGFKAKVTTGNSASLISTVGNFTDVKKTDYFADAVLWAVEQKITSGTSATTFSPGTTCSKAQILTFLWRASGSPEPTAANPFTDIKPADYYYKAALWAAEKGLVSSAAFGASTDCTRAMTVEYLWKAAGSPTAAKQASFNDVPASADYAQAVAWAVENGVTSGTGNGNFSPAATCTRGQIATFLYRAMGK